MTLLRKTADNLAIILHPVFLFFYAYLGYWLFTTEISHGIRNFIIILVLTVAVPIGAVIILAGDIHLANREKRFLPLGVALMGYILAYYALDYSALPMGIFLMLLRAIIISTILILFLNIFLKVSMHANAYGIVMFILMLTWDRAEDNPFAKILIFLALILMLFVLWQRLASGSHKILEIILGLIVGASSAILSFLILLSSD